jgi:hypothetical protein
MTISSHAGMDLFEFTGFVAYPDGDSHVIMQTEDGCVTCHMNDGFGDMRALYGNDL